MRVLLSAFALTALLLLAAAASVFAADGALVADAPATVEPVAPPPSGTEATGPVTETLTEAAGPAVEVVTETADPIVGVAEPVVAPIVDVVGPVVDPIVDVAEPVVGPIVDVVEPVVDPILDAVEPVVGPIVDVVEPILAPVVDVVGPVTPPILGLVDLTQPDGASSPALDAAGVLPSGIAASIVATSWMTDPAWPPLGSDPATPDPRPVRVVADAPGLSTPAGLPYQRDPLPPLFDVAGLGSSLSLGAWIALLTAGLLAIVFHAFRRPWSSFPTLRGRSLLPALRPA
ncbi:MAG: hypothetical protein ACAH65_05850 [Chloroflexota bacterium]